MADLRITEINIYPVKSTAAISLAESRVTPKGLALDRRWMLVDQEGQAITGREFPALTLVRSCANQQDLALTASGMPELRIPYECDADMLRAVVIWGDECTAIALGEDADRWFSQYLGYPCHLVQMSDAHPRQLDPDVAHPGDAVSFADGFPLLIISAASLEDLNRRLSAPVSMGHFRPNLVVNGCVAYAEDSWRQIRIGDVVFEGVKNCSRCVFTTIDPDTGMKHPRQEPLRTLGTYRRRVDGGVFFGQNFIPRGEGTVRLNDTVEIVA